MKAIGSATRLLVWLAACTTAFWLPQGASAQVLYGSLVGRVEDQSGGSVPAAVTLTSRDTGGKRETRTDAAGRFGFPNLLPGIYDVEVSAAGFRGAARSGMRVTANQVSRAEFRLELGPVTEEITVTAGADPLQTDTSDTRAQLGATLVATLPLNIYRNYQALINLVPGAMPGEFQNSATDAPGRGLRHSVNGTPFNNNNTRLDGAINVNVWLPHHTMYTAPAETIEVVNVVTGSFDAEQGMAGGAAITVITKSGTNEPHGSAFEYHSNQHLRARNFFMAPGAAKPRDTLNMFGGTLGGPVVRGRLFFFGSFEGMRQRTGGSGRFTVPTLDQRRGEFGAHGGTVYDPATGRPDGRERLPFAGDVVPGSRISAVSRRILDLLPAPNLPGTTANFFAAATGRFDRNHYDAKFNWNRGERHAIWGKYSVLEANVTGVPAFGELIGPGVVSDPGRGHTFVQVPTIGHTYTFSPTLLVDQNLAFTRMSQDVRGIDFGRNYGTEVFGIPGTNGPDIRQSGMPGFEFDGIPNSHFGAPTWMPLFRKDQSFTHTSNVTWIRGAHELRSGFDLIRHHLNHWQPEAGGGPRGRFNFRGGATALRGGAPPNQFNTFAAFLLGLPFREEKTLQYLPMSGREWQFGWYLRDRWQVSRRLTLNAGLRIEHYPLMSRASTGMERLDLDTMQVYLGGRGGVAHDAGISVNTPLPAPRAGFAFRLNDATVIRSGYGLTWDPLPFSRPLRGWYPHSIAATFQAPSEFQAFGPIEQGIPSFTGPDLAPGVVPLPPNVEQRSPWDEIRRGYIQSWNFTLERRFPGRVTGSVAYVGTQTTHQMADRDVNAAGPGQGGAGRPLFARFGRMATTRMWDGWLSGNYHSLQASVDRQFSRGLLLKGAYTWGKAINMTDEDGWAELEFNWGPMVRHNRAVAGYDRTHVLQLAWIWEAPLGRGKRFLAHGPLAWIAGNWQVNGLSYLYSGTPFNVRSSGASLNAPGNGQFADQVKPEAARLGGIGPGQPYYDPSAFAPVREARFGTAGRNRMRGPGVAGVDASLFRLFPITESCRLEFRAEALNLTNTPRFANPGGNASNPGSFMQITATRSQAGTTDSDRQFRFGLRLAF